MWTLGVCLEFICVWIEQIRCGWGGLPFLFGEGLCLDLDVSRIKVINMIDGCVTEFETVAHSQPVHRLKNLLFIMRDQSLDTCRKSSTLSILLACQRCCCCCTFTNKNSYDRIALFSFWHVPFIPFSLLMLQVLGVYSRENFLFFRS